MFQFLFPSPSETIMIKENGYRSNMTFMLLGPLYLVIRIVVEQSFTRWEQPSRFTKRRKLVFLRRRPEEGVILRWNECQYFSNSLVTSKTGPV